MRTVVSRQHRQWIISALLIALFVRALIPAGFMPAMDRPLSFQICPDGYPAQLLRQGMPSAHTHHHHDGAGVAETGHAHHHGDMQLAQAGAPTHDSGPEHSGPHTHGIASGEHCVFAAVAAVSSFSFNAAFVAIQLERSTRDIPYVSPAIVRERFVLPPSRGPPALS